MTLLCQIVAEPHGALYFDFELICQEWCYFEIYDNNKYLTSFWNSGAEEDNGKLLLFVIIAHDGD